MNTDVSPVTRAPLRISFAGGGTDVEPYRSDYGSHVLSAAIRMYAYAIKSGKAGQDNLEVLLERMSGARGIHISSDVHPGSGLGGSASALIAGLNLVFASITKDHLVNLAWFTERHIMNIAGGNQDFYCAAHGGVQFISSEGVQVEVSKLTAPDGLFDLLLLVHAGLRVKEGSNIIQEQVANYNVKALHRQKQLAREMRGALHQANLLAFGELLEEAWRCKKEMCQAVSTPSVDELHDRALGLGALAAQLMGAGGGGYMLVMEHPSRRGELREQLIKAGIPYHNVDVDLAGVVQL